ncbi:MAG TPA: hypothetical protein P5092_16900 [Ruminococcus sp.]|nr:hypothetical protein [Ruminococcus sp.]
MNKLISVSAALVIMVSCICASSCGRQTGFSIEENQAMNAESVTEEQLTANLSESTVTETSAAESEPVDLSGIPDHYTSEEIKLPEDIDYIYEITNVGGNEFRLAYDAGFEEGLKEYYTDRDISNFTFVETEVPQECGSVDFYVAMNDMETISDGCIIYLLQDHGGIKAPDEFDENFDYASYNKNCKKTYIMAEYKDGKVVRTIPIKFAEGTEGDNLMQVADFEDQMLYIKGAGELYSINKADGSVNRIADLTEGVSPEVIENYCFESYILKGRDGDPYIAYTDTESGEEGVYKIRKVEGDSLSDSFFTFKIDVFFPVAGYGKYQFVVYGDNYVSGICDDGSMETIIDLKKSGLPEMNLCALGNGEFLGYYNIGEEAEDATHEPHLVKLTPVYDSEQ